MTADRSSPGPSLRLRLRRLLPAPPEEVFDAWTDPEQVRQWLCPGTGTVPEASIDARPGGRFRIIMRSEGRDYVHTGEYRELVRPRRLVFTWISEETAGRESLVTVELRRRGGRTEMTLTHEALPDDASRDRHRGGWSSILDRLEGRLGRHRQAGDPEGR